MSRAADKLHGPRRNAPDITSVYVLNPNHRNSDYATEGADEFRAHVGFHMGTQCTIQQFNKTCQSMNPLPLR